MRLLRGDGTQIGIVTLDQALEQAKTAGVDAVEIAPAANPPVVKLVNYKKFLYQQHKKERAAKAGQKVSDLKEIRLTPFMAPNDFGVKMARGRQFLQDGHKLRLTVRFKGRQLGHKEFGDQVLTRALQELTDIAGVDQAAKWEGRQYVTTLTPIKGKPKHAQS